MPKYYHDTLEKKFYVTNDGTHEKVQITEAEYKVGIESAENPEPMPIKISKTVETLLKPEPPKTVAPPVKPVAPVKPIPEKPVVIPAISAPISKSVVSDSRYIEPVSVIETEATTQTTTPQVNPETETVIKAEPPKVKKTRKPGRPKKVKGS